MPRMPSEHAVGHRHQHAAQQAAHILRRTLPLPSVGELRRGDQRDQDAALVEVVFAPRKATLNSSRTRRVPPLCASTLSYSTSSSPRWNRLSPLKRRRPFSRIRKVEAGSAKPRAMSKGSVVLPAKVTRKSVKSMRSKTCSVLPTAWVSGATTPISTMPEVTLSW